MDGCIYFKLSLVTSWIPFVELIRYFIQGHCLPVRTWFEYRLRRCGDPGGMAHQKTLKCIWGLSAIAPETTSNLCLKRKTQSASFQAGGDDQASSVWLIALLPPISHIPPPPVQNLALFSGSLCSACPLLIFHHLSNIIFAWTTPAS